MSDEDKEVRLARAVEALSPQEQYALVYSKENKQMEVSRDKADEMFDLFLNGKTCDEIRKLNKGIGLGQIVNCRVRDEWDARRDEHRRSLIEQVPPRVKDAQLIAADFLSDLLAASVLLHWDNIKKYLQDKNKAHLEGTPLEKGVTFKQIKEIVEMLRAVTGQENRKTVQVEGSVDVNQNQPTPVAANVSNVLETLAIEPVVIKTS